MQQQVYAESIPVGYTNIKSRGRVQQIVNRMKTVWLGAEYDLNTRNCVDFARAFCEELGVDTVPASLDKFVKSWLPSFGGLAVSSRSHSSVAAPAAGRASEAGTAAPPEQGR